MKAIGAMGLLCVHLAACGVEGAPASASSPALTGEWAVTAATATAERAVVAGRLTLTADHAWRLRYDYRATDGGQVWSSGLSGRWQLQPGEPPAVRFEVSDDRSTGVGLLRDPRTMEVALGGIALRLVRAPE